MKFRRTIVSESTCEVICAVRAPAVGPLDRQLGFLRITPEQPQTFPLPAHNTSTSPLEDTGINKMSTASALGSFVESAPPGEV